VEIPLTQQGLGEGDHRWCTAIRLSSTLVNGNESMPSNSPPRRGVGGQIRLLGPVEVWNDGVPLDAGTNRQRWVLAALAVDAGRSVLVDTVVDRVGGESPPLRARETVYVYIGRIRKMLAAAGTGAIGRWSNGYVLEGRSGAGRHPSVPATGRGGPRTGLPGGIAARADRPVSTRRVAARGPAQGAAGGRTLGRGARTVRAGRKRLAVERLTAACARLPIAPAILRAIGDRDGEAATLIHLGDSHRALGDETAARGAWQEALDVLTDLDHPNTADVRARLGS
jgi:hypothetical protein